MRQAAQDDELLTRYLLGELSEHEQEEVEQRYISDRELYDQLLTVEDDLIDAYVQGELSQSRRTSFERRFLRTDERRARVEFAIAWMAYVARQGEKAPASHEPARRLPLPWFLRFESWPRPLRAAAAVLLILAAAGLAAETLRLRNRIEQTESQKAALEANQRELQEQMDAERRHTQELSAALEREREALDRKPTPQVASEQTPSEIVSLILTPGLVRGGGGARRLIIPAEARQVTLRVNFERGDYSSYRVAIATVEGRMIWSRAGLKAQSSGAGKTVVVRPPASVFATEDYILTLSGVNTDGSHEEISKYSFGASKK